MPPQIEETARPEEKGKTIEKWDLPRASPDMKFEISYGMCAAMAFIHVSAIYGGYLLFTSSKWATIIFQYCLYVVGSMGSTAGTHRLWSHKSYKAKLPLQIILMVLNSMLMQLSAIWWVHVHRLHHKFSDTDGDPFNASRGLFFSHVGWLLVKQHPKITELSKLIDMSDIYNNPVLRFQKKYANVFIPIVALLLPTMIPVYMWGENLTDAWHLNILRIAIFYHIIFTINSVGHKWGFKPFDRNIAPTQNLFLGLLAFGDGFHNFHHAFPWDYRSSEIGITRINVTTRFIEFWARIGWAYDLRSASEELIRNRIKRTGDGSVEVGEYEDFNLQEI